MLQKHFMFIALYLTVGFFSIPSYASINDNPFVIIRFINEDTPFLKKLSDAASLAKEQHTSLQFDIISYVPLDSNESWFPRNKTAKKKAELRIEQIVSTLRNVGFSSNQMKVSYQMDSARYYNEVRIYLR